MSLDATVVDTLVFDVGNTLHHIDHAFIAETVSVHARPTTEDQVAIAEYSAKAAIDALFRARLGGDDTSRQFSYFGTILDTLEIAAAQHEPILAALTSENQSRSLWRVMRPDTPRFSRS